MTLSPGGKENLPNLELLHSLHQNRITVHNTFSEAGRDQAIRDATGLWIRERRGKGWVILNMEISTIFGVAWEHSTSQQYTKQFGLLKHYQENFMAFRDHPHLLVIVEVDPLSMEKDKHQVNSLITDEGSRLLVLSRKGW